MKLPQTVKRWFKPKPPPKLPPIFAGSLLAGSHALITGGAGLIGRGLTAAFLDQEAQVAITDCHKAGLHEAAQAYPQIQTIAAEIAHSDKIIESLATDRPFPDILVNNVGEAAERYFMEETADDWEMVFRTNLFAPLALTRRIAEEMIRRQIAGNIIFISSVHQELPSRWPSYSASKAALTMVIKELAAELAPYHIRVNGIAPGWVAQESQPFRLALLGQQTIEPAYIGHAAAFLACNALSRYTTGTILTVDAGMSLVAGRVLIDQPQIKGGQR